MPITLSIATILFILFLISFRSRSNLMKLKNRGYSLTLTICIVIIGFIMIYTVSEYLSNYFFLHKEENRIFVSLIFLIGV